MKKEKTGRNDLCPCNSGKKFKKCCINKNESKKNLQPIIYHTHQVILNKFFETESFNTYSEKEKFETKLLASITEDENPDDIGELLKKYIVECENFIKKIATKHDRYSLLFWSRRLGPKNLFDVAELSVMLYREIQTLGIYKYGTSKEELITNKQFGIIPKNLVNYYEVAPNELYKILNKENLNSEVISIISDVIRIEILSYLFLNATQLYRIYNKGATVKVNKTRNGFTYKIPKDISTLINLYDDRLLKANLFSIIGAFVTEFPENYNSETFCPHFQLNVDHKIELPLYNPKTESYKKLLKNDESVGMASNYLLGGIDLKNIFNFLNLFKDEFEKSYEFTVENFIVFLAYLGYKLNIGIIESLEFQINILNRAYSVHNFDIQSFEVGFIKKYSELYKLIFNKDANDSCIKSIDAKIIINKFLLKSTNQKDLDLWTRGPKRIFYQLSNNNMVIDYTSLGDILTYIAKDLTRLDGDVGNRRAISFEDSLVKEIKRNFNQKDIWTNKKIIKANGLKKEIDANFIIQDVLFILEAKAINVSFDFDKGEEKAIEFRTNKMIEAINESNEKASFIKLYKNDLTIKLPKNINYICPLVISSYPEYIWSKTDELFLSQDELIPRILTINDISNTLKKINIDSIKLREWVLKV